MRLSLLQSCGQFEKQFERSGGRQWQAEDNKSAGEENMFNRSLSKGLSPSG
jgi:hypothetical protein